VAQQSFRELGPRRIVNAEKEYACLHTIMIER
jgi:hypothetical protein